MLALWAGLVAFCGGLAIICYELVPLVNPSEGASGADDAVPWTAYMAAALMGAGDATANTVVLSRLGSLADESGLLPRETACQYFQVANVAMTALAFLYAPLLPLTVSPYQPLLLAFLAICGGVSFSAGLRTPADV